MSPKKYITAIVFHSFSEAIDMKIAINDGDLFGMEGERYALLAHHESPIGQDEVNRAAASEASAAGVEYSWICFDAIVDA